eukprot:gnl/Hemi2/20326_TR6744_c0_g1_i1.p2 gnl/Hemi2/20326_TR6744_c0_g1~~gnl/Hemi2/20326_TR6744_c0_g1_i1.p2  ORF type:complete len:146 (+),score=52.81 gnl/Hemi2/20326_TR6744_c0_g1_i1:43-438(+)
MSESLVTGENVGYAVSGYQNRATYLRWGGLCACGAVFIAGFISFFLGSTIIGVFSLILSVFMALVEWPVEWVLKQLEILENGKVRGGIYIVCGIPLFFGGIFNWLAAIILIAAGLLNLICGFMSDTYTGIV